MREKNYLHPKNEANPAIIVKYCAELFFKNTAKIPAVTATITDKHSRIAKT